MLILQPYQQQTQQSVWDITTTIAETAIRYVLTWHDRSQSWYIDTYLEGVPVIKGRRVVVNFSLQRHYRIEGLPFKDMIVVPTGEGYPEVTYESLGREHLIVFLEESDLE